MCLTPAAVSILAAAQIEAEGCFFVARALIYPSSAPGFWVVSLEHTCWWLPRVSLTGAAKTITMIDGSPMRIRGLVWMYGCGIGGWMAASWKVLVIWGNLEIKLKSYTEKLRYFRYLCLFWIANENQLRVFKRSELKWAMLKRRWWRLVDL